jgi:hypothetical protein
MLLHYADGRVLAGVLLTVKGAQMRVAVKDAEDIAEFNLMNGVWISECCETVTFEFPIAAFQAMGMVPDAETLNLNPQPDFFVHRQSTAKVATVVN